MKRVLLYVILLAILLPSCRSSGRTVSVVKPKYHHRWFDRKKDKKVKRTKVVRMRN